MSVGEGERVEVTSAADRRAEQLRRLAAAALLLNSTVEIDDLLAVITAQARETIGAHQAVTSLTVGDDGTQAVASVASTETYAGWPVSEERLAEGELVAQVSKENRPLRLTQAELQERAHEREPASRPPLRGWLAAPLVGREGGNLGVVQLCDKEHGQFDGEDEAILVQLAQMASAALENARLYDDARRRADELDAIHRLAEAVAIARGLDEVFDVALEALEQALGVERGSVVLFESSGSIHFRAWRGLSESYRAAVEGRTPWKGHANDPSPFVVDDVLADPEVAELHEAFRAEGIRSMAIVPLLHAGTILGRVVLYADRPAAFAPPDLRLAVSMASHVAATLERRRAVDQLVESRNQLAAIFASVADGITAQDPSGRLVFANDAAAQLSGFDSADELLAAEPAEVIGRFEILDEEGAPLPLDRLPGRLAIATGHEAEQVLCYRLVGTGEQRWSIVRATPLLDGDGRVELAINVFHDITEPKLAERRLRFLSGASEALAGSLDVEATLAAVARLVVPELADYCVIDLLDGHGSLSQVVLVHADPEGEQALRALRARRPVDDLAHPIRRVIADGQPIVVLAEEETYFDRVALDDDHRRQLRELGVTSFVAQPLVARGRTLGAMSLGTSVLGRRLTEADVTIAFELAERAALAVDNARLYEEAQTELSERQLSEERLRFLGRASQVLAGSLDYETTLTSVARLAVPRVADWCIVYELRPGGGIRRLAVEHAGGSAEAVRAVLDRYPLDPAAERGVPAVLRTGEPELVVEETSERLTADVGDPAALANELAGIVPTSSIYAPLVARGRTIGAIALLSAESGRRYGSDDLELAVELARRAAVAVDNARLYREATESLAQLEAVLVSAPVGVGFWDRELRYVRVNDALAAINRLPAAEHMGRPLRTVVPQLADALEPLYQQVLDTGEPVVHQESTNPDANALGGERHWLSSYFPVRAEDETIGVGAVILEITDRERAQQRARFVARASEILASSLMVEEVMPAIAEHAVESFCDSCTVWTLDDGTLHRIARANASSERAQALAELDSYDVAADADVPLVRVVRTGQAYHVPALDHDELQRAARSPEEAELLTTHAALSLMILPLVVRGRIFGAVALGSRAPGRHDDDDYAAAEELARRIAVHLDRVGLHAEATETAALLRAVVEQMPSGLAIADATGELLLHNEQAEVIWRRPWSEATVWEHTERSVGFHPDGRRYAPEEWPFARAVSEGELVAAEEIEIERGDGSRGVIEVSAAPVRDGKGNVVAGVATFDDVTARREAESRLRESARAAQALEFVGDGVFLIDGDGRVALWNPAAAAITGIAREEVVGRSADEALAGWPLDRLGDRTETHPVELDTRELWLSLSAVQFPEGTVYAFRDLTEEYAVERLKSDFVSTVSHELRTPLAAIYGAAMTLQRVDVSLAEDQRIGLLGVVANESERLARIVNDVLWASRLDSGVLAVSIESCDPATLAAAVVNAARVHVPPGIELFLDLEAGLPDVAADPDKVRQVLVNLVDNAIKYSPDGGLVEVRVAAGEHTVRFAVSDPGLGIPPAEHARIFEKFYRLDPNLTRGVGGTGLGLYICRELVRRMDGRIWVDSEEGGGSTFTFELPVAAR